MQVFSNIVQGTEEWHQIKWGKVGGTSSKGLFVPSDTLLIQLLAEHTEEFEMDEDDYCSPEMLRGIELEPLARQELEQYTGLKFDNPGWLQSDEIGILGISPDGITDDGISSCEIKCPGGKRHIGTVYGKDIPSDNIHQSLHYFTVNPNLQVHYFCSFRPESKYRLFVKKITLDSVIDLGTKAKPNCKKVSEWAQIARKAAYELEANLQLALQQLDNI